KSGRSGKGNFRRRAYGVIPKKCRRNYRSNNAATETGRYRRCSQQRRLRHHSREAARAAKKHLRNATKPECSVGFQQLPAFLLLLAISPMLPTCDRARFASLRESGEKLA